MKKKANPLLEGALRWRPTALAALLALLLAWPALTNLRHAFVQAHRFHLTVDEALHAEVIERLAQTGTYAAWTGPAFAPRLTTGPAVIVPAAAMSWITGVSGAGAGRAWIVIFHVLTLVLVARMGARAAPPTWGIRGSVIGAAAAAGIFETGWRGLRESEYFLFGILGEGALAFFVTVALYFLLRRGRDPEPRPWLPPLAVGLAASLASLAKPYAILFPLVLAGWALVRIVRHPRERGARLLLLGGIAAPWLAWLAWMAAVLGVAGTWQFWADYPRLMREVNGAGLPGAGHLGFGGWLTLVKTHLLAVFDFLKPRSVLLAAVGLAGLWRLRRAFPAARALLVYAVLHGAWWVFLSPDVQSRYLVPFLVLAWVAIVPALLEPIFLGLRTLVPEQLLDPPTRVGPVLAALCAAGLAMVTQAGLEWRRDLREPGGCGFCRQLAAQGYWRGVAGTASRPASLWSTARGSDADSDLVLSAPYELRTFAVASDQSQAREGWVLVGENPQEGTEAYLRLHGYRPVFTLPGSTVGFWTLDTNRAR
jgi:hypothetical protein